MSTFIARATVLGAIGILPFTLPVPAPASAPASKPTAEFKSKSGIHRMAVSLDRKYLALAHEDGLLTLLDAATLRVRAPLVKQQGPRIECLAFSPDSATLATGTFAGSCSLWPVPAGTPARVIARGGPVEAVAFTPNGQGLVVYLPVGMIGTWDIAAGARRGTVTLTGPGSDQLQRVAVFSEDTKTLAISGGLDADHTVRVWNTTTGKLRRHFKGYPQLVDCLALTPDGGRLITGSEDGMVRVWDVASGKALGTWKVGGFLRAVAISRDGKRVAASTDATPEVRVWDLASAQVVTQLPGHPDGARDLVFFPDGRRLVSAAFDLVKTWALP